MKINIIGIVGAIIAFIGLALPWWTVTFSLTMEANLSYSASIYLYQTTASGIGTTVTGQMNLWFGWVAFALLVLGALFGIAGSLMPRARAMLIVGGILALLSVIVFAAGLQNYLSTTSGLSSFGLFSSGSFTGYSYVTYLSFGFWLTLIGAIVILASWLNRPKATAPTAVAPPPPEQEKTTTPTS